MDVSSNPVRFANIGLAQKRSSYSKRRQSSESESASSVESLESERHAPKSSRRPLSALPRIEMTASTSTTSLASVTSLPTPPLTRSPSFDSEEIHTPTASAPNPSYTLIPTTIPIEHVHVHQGTFYYPPSSIPLTSPYHDETRGSGSNSLASLSRRLTFGKRSKKQATNDKKKSSLLLPTTTQATLTRVTGPAILVVPPRDAPCEVYRPSIQRLALKHANSVLSRHPLAEKQAQTASTSSPSATASSLPLSPSSSSLASSVSSASISSVSSISPASASPRPDTKSISSLRSPNSSPSVPKSPRFLNSIASHAKKALLPHGEPSTYTYSVSELPKPGHVQREGGVVLPEALRPDEIDEDHLSLSWETRKHKKARAEKAERIRLAKEAAAKRLFEENMNRYRTPFMGF